MKIKNQKPRPRGFALIVTLSLMILLTVIAVGLLTLSSVSLRTASQEQAMATARANARLGLMLAIGELQRSAGPDQRVTAPANLVDPAMPLGVTGVWNSWKPDSNGITAADYTDRKSGENFLGYLISDPNPPAPGTSPDPKAVPSGSLVQKLVGSGTLGPNAHKDQEISAPIILTDTTASGSKRQGGYAWVVMDEGVKGRIDLEPADKAGGLGDEVARMGSPARNRFEGVTGLEFLEDPDVDSVRTNLPKLVSLKAAELASSSPENIAPYFHDFTVSSVSLQTNVADGGLKTDLSIAFEGDYRDKLPSDFESNYLYSNNSTPFQGSSTNSDPLWSLYANYSRLYRLDTADDGNALAGLKTSLPVHKLIQVTSSPGSNAAPYYEPDMATVTEPILMPTVVAVDMVFSLVVRDTHGRWANPEYPNMLHLMYLPIITLHNPYSVPLRCKDFRVGFADVPIGFKFYVANRPATKDFVTLNQLTRDAKASAQSKVFSVTLSTSLSADAEVVMAAGETKIFGIPFEPGSTWDQELKANGDLSKGASMFDWASNITNRDGARMIPGLMTGPNDGIGFDVDWLAPDGLREAWADARSHEGVVFLGDKNDTQKKSKNESVHVEYKPMTINSSAENNFTIATSMKIGGGPDVQVGNTQVFYNNQATLTRILEEGTSLRYPKTRSFPDQSRKTSASAIKESGNTAFKDYVKPLPFAIFSVSAKTTMESFTKGRPVTDTGIAFPMATCDLTGSTTSQGASPLEFALIPQIGSGQSPENNGESGYFFGGHGATNGTTAATFYEIPLAPLQSIAQLRNANGASLGASPLVTYSVGESRAHPAIPSSDAYTQASSRTLLDHSWLANSRLWDGYWFSSLATLEGPAYSGSAGMSQAELAKQFFSGTQSLPNPRNTPYFPAGKPVVPEDAALAAVAEDGKITAAFIVTEGGFNVNSTSIPAWAAVLSSLAKSDVPLADGSLEANTDMPFLRVRRPVLGAQADPTEKLWNSYRTLTALEVTTLAEKIVDEVRMRGPFLSMADFVNRRLGASGPLTDKGAVQAALDNTTLNAIMNGNALPISPADVANYGWKNPGAVSGTTGAGAPGEISQGDVLSVIGSFISVRSDTFRIRSYGDARDRNGKVIAKAWCEATLQRVPDYIDPTDTPEAIADSDANITFGRQFKVVTFRWLSDKEV